MKIYTKTGDKGQTSLYDGTRIDKDSLRVDAYGTIDELNSYIGLSRNYVKDKEVDEILFKIQKKLFFIAGELATKEDGKFKRTANEQDIKKLEDIIDEYLKKIDTVNAFIVPGTSLASANLHVARTVCRRAERRIITLSKEENINPLLIKYVNRLSDTLYAMARYSEEKIIHMNFDDEV
jgi:cob(I)alamin adenosyltransferase